MCIFAAVITQTVSHGSLLETVLLALSNCQALSQDTELPSSPPASLLPSVHLPCCCYHINHFTCMVRHHTCPCHIEAWTFVSEEMVLLPFHFYVLETILYCNFITWPLQGVIGTMMGSQRCSHLKPQN